MKQIIVNVGGLSIEEKQSVNEALAKIQNVLKIEDVTTGMAWFYAPSYSGLQVGWNSFLKSETPTHTPQQVLEMAGMATKRKVRKDFDTAKEYSVDVSECTEEEKKEVQQAFFDAGFPWEYGGKAYRYINADKYTNTQSDGNITAYCMYGYTSDGFNMTTIEFLDLVYEPEQQGHIHSELMFQYAEDAKTHTEPWVLWQIKDKYKDDVWICCLRHPVWATHLEYRRKLNTHNVNGVEIPDLRIKPKNGQGYWYPDASIEALVCGGVHGYESSVDSHRLTNNLCYEPTEDGKQAAILHAKAWLGIA